MTDEPLISVLLPCFHKAMDFFRSAEHNILWTDKRVELCIICDEPSEERFYHWWINRQGKRFRVRLLVCDESHEWRPPCVALNAGIRHARGLYLVVMSPESVLMFPNVNYLFTVLEKQERPFYLTGLLAGAAISDIRDGTSFQRLYHNQFNTPVRGYGFILFKRKDALAVGGYDESRKTYAGDDDLIRRNLKAYGCTPILDEKIRVIHIDGETRPTRIAPAEPLTDKLRLKMPPSAFRVASDWTND